MLLELTIKKWKERASIKSSANGLRRSREHKDDETTSKKQFLACVRNQVLFANPDNIANWHF